MTYFTPSCSIAYLSNVLLHLVSSDTSGVNLLLSAETASPRGTAMTEHG